MPSLLQRGIKINTDQQLKEEPSVFVGIFSADPGADNHLQGQLLMKLLQEKKYKCFNSREPVLPW